MHAVFDGHLLLVDVQDPGGSSLAVPLLVGNEHIDIEYDNGDQLDDIANQHGDVSRMVMRSFTVLECLRANDVADAIASEENGRGELLLGVSGDIGADHGQTHAEAQALEIAEPQANHAAPFVAVGQSDQQRGSHDTDRVGNDHGDAPQVRPARTDDAAAQQGYELHRAAGDLQILRAQGVDVERLDHQAGELRDGRIRHLCPRRHHKQYPRLWVPQRLPQLVLLEVSVLDPLPVC